MASPLSVASAVPPPGPGRTLVVHSARLIEGGESTEDAWLRIEGGRVVARGVGRGWTPADEVVDASGAAGPGAVLTPGFVDIHCHGGGGASFEDGPDSIRAARALHRKHGTTRALVSLVSAPLEELARRAADVAELMKTDADILGSHLEGPFLDRGRHGAHDPSHLREPAAADVARLLEAGDGTVRQVTLAPELPGAFDAIRLIIEAGSSAAVGHTNADATMVARAFDAGASILTHAFNAMPGIHHRAPGPVLAATADERVTLEVIADGVHLDPLLIALLFRAAPGRVALVTDAMAAAGNGDGAYALGPVDVTVADGVARADRTGSIAGSTLTQDAALRCAVAAGATLEQAVGAMTSTPAAAIGHGLELGRLTIGSLGDAVLLDAQLRVRQVWVAGRLVS